MGVLPLVIIALFRLGTSAKPWRPAAAVAALTGLELYAGNMQFVLYALLVQAMAAVYILAKQGQGHGANRGLDDRRDRDRGTVGALVLLPFLELQTNAFRPTNKYAGLNFLPPAQLLEWVFPRFYGHPGNGDYVVDFFTFVPTVRCLAGRAPCLGAGNRGSRGPADGPCGWRSRPSSGWPGWRC